MSIADTISRFDGLPEGQRIDYYRSQGYDGLRYLIAEMHARGWRNRDLVGVIGSRARVSDVLSGRRKLTIHMIRRLVFQRRLNAELLLKIDDDNHATGSA